MPLPPVADNNTDRYWLKYTSVNIEHEICFRLGSSTTSTDGIATANALANALKAYMRTADSFTALRYSVAGSSVSFPLAWTAVVGTNGGAIEDDDKTNFYSLVGRSAAGYRCRITFFTPHHGDTDGFRHTSIAAGMPATLYTAVTSLSPVLVAKNGQGVIWNAYVNSGWNSYWQRRSR